MGLSNHQLESVKAGIKGLRKNRFAFTQGFAGVGKTYLMQHLVNGTLPPEVKLPYFSEIVGTAPTWAAARQAKKSTGLHFVSNHKLLYGKPKEDERGGLIFGRAHNKNIPRNALVLADEAGMNGQKIGGDLEAMCQRSNAMLWAFGDNFQLGPVKDKRYFGNDRITYTLTEVVRQNPGPGLTMLTSMRNSGCKTYSDMARFADQSELVDCKMLRPKLVRAFAEKFIKRGTGQIICHRNKTRTNINKECREYLGFSKQTLSPGERIVFLSNTAGVVNSDVATIVEMGKAPPDDYDKLQAISFLDLRFREVTLMDGRQVVISLTLLENGWQFYKTLAKEIKKIPNRGYKRDLEEALRSFPMCDYAYAITGHKSQGSQFEEVFAVLEYSQINWLYTVCSRFQKQLMFSWA